jgi:hypothetical protein
MLSYPSIGSIPALAGQCFATAPTPPKGAALASTTNPCFFTGGTGTLGTTAGYTGVASPGGYQFGSFDVPQGNLFDVYDHQASGRVDRRLSVSNDFYARYLVDDLNTPQAILAPTGDVAYSNLGALPDSRSILRQRSQSAMIDERYARSTSLNEVRFSFSRIAQGLGPYDLPSTLRSLPSATVLDQFGGFSDFQGNFPAAGSVFTLGQDTSTSVTRSNVYEAQENYSLTHNRHSLKLGADVVRTQSNILNVPSDLGHYFFGLQNGGFSQFINEPSAGQTNAVAVLQTLPDVLTNSAGVIVGQGQNELPLRETDVAIFVQDDFHLRPNLDLSAGLRYERFGQPIDGIVKMNPLGGPMVPTSAGDFGPRVGLAWALKGNTVIRAGYALMYNQMPLNIPLLMWQSAPVSPTVASITPSGEATVGLTGLTLPVTGTYPHSPLTWQAVSLIKVAGCSGYSSTGYELIMTPGSVPLSQCSIQNTVVPNLVVPYIQNWTAGVQRELSRNMVLDVTYAGSRGTDLYQRQDSNPLGGWNASCLASSGGSITCFNPRGNNAHGDITTITNSGLSTYNALQATLSTRTLQMRGHSTLNFTVSYTYSHMIDTDSEIFGQGVRVFNGSFFTAILAQRLANIEAITPFPQCASCSLSAERGNSAYDRRHRFVFSEIWGLPTPTSSAAAKHILGGWNINGIGTVQSGQPFSPLNAVLNDACADANGDGIISNDRPDIGNLSQPLSSVALLKNCSSPSAGYNLYVYGSSPPTSVTRSQAYSEAHFVQVPLGTSPGGSAGRNILTGPAIIDFDFALFKQFRWGETKALEFRWEVYNALNHPNPAYLVGNVFAAGAQPTPGFAFSPYSSAAGLTGVIPENAIDATTTGNAHDFLSKGNMNTGNRTMQFGVHFTF